MDVAGGRGQQEVGVASGWNLWVWLECVGVVSVWRYIDILIIIITFPYSTCISSFLAAASLLLCSVFIWFFVLVYVIFVQYSKICSRNIRDWGIPILATPNLSTVPHFIST